MASSYSELKFELIATGEQSGTWGNTTNSNIGTAINEAIAGMATVAITGDTTLSWANTVSTQAARNYVLKLTGTPAADFTLTVPTIHKPYIVLNGTTRVATVKTSAGTGVAIPANKSAMVYTNGTDVISAFDYVPSVSLGAALSIASGGTGATAVSSGLVKSNGTVFSSVAAPSGAVVGTTDTQTLTNKTIQPRIYSVANFASAFAPEINLYDMFVSTAQSNGSVFFDAPTGTPYNGQKIIIRMTASTTTSLSFSGASYRAVGVTLPTTLLGTYTLYLGCIWNSTASKWDVVAVNSGI